MNCGYIIIIMRRVYARAGVSKERKKEREREKESVVLLEHQLRERMQRETDDARAYLQCVNADVRNV